MVVAQLVERSLSIPEVRGSNPVIGKNLNWTLSVKCTYWKDENKEKEAANGPFFKKSNPISQRVTTEFFLNSDNFQNSPKVAVGFGYFCNKICHLNLPKIAQSCHTGRLNTLDNTLRRRRFSHFFSCLLTKSWSVLNFQ